MDDTLTEMIRHAVEKYYERQETRYQLIGFVNGLRVENARLREALGSLVEILGEASRDDPYYFGHLTDKAEYEKARALLASEVGGLGGGEETPPQTT